MRQAKAEFGRIESLYKKNNVSTSTYEKVRADYIAAKTAFSQTAADLCGLPYRRAGLTDQQELLTAEVKLNEAEYLLLQGRGDFETGLMVLNSLIGVPFEAQTSVGEKVARAGDVPATQDTSLRPEIKIAQERMKMERSHLRLNDVQYKPQLYVGANGGYFAPGY